MYNIQGGAGDIWHTLTTGHKFLAANEPWISPDIVGSSILIVFVGGGLGTFASYVSSQDIVQRFTTTTDIKQLYKMTLGNGVLSIFAATLFFLVGTGLYVFYQQHPELLVHVKQDLIFASYITYELPQGMTGILLAAIYAAAQSTLSTGINSVATSWVLDIQPVFSKNVDTKTETRMAQYISLGIGILAIAVSVIMAHSDIKSAYTWFNGFVGLALGALAGVFVLGAFSKTTNAMAAFIGFVVATVVVFYVKTSFPWISFWAYAPMNIVVTWIVAHLWAFVTRSTFKAPEGTTYR